MSARQILLLLTGYITLVAIAVWFNLAVLCQGDSKFDGGCGGFGVYIPLWELFLAPLPIAAIGLEHWRKAELPPTRRLVAYLAWVMVVTEVGWLLLDTFPALLATEAIAIAGAWLVRAKVTGRRARQAPPSAR